MHTTILATFLETSRTAVSMCIAGILLFPIGLWAARTDIASASGLDKIVALSNLCFAIPLAVFGAEHLSGAKSIMLGVPSYMPWHLFWAYFVGCALVAASLSIATKIQVRWSGLLFGIMMLIFVAMLHIPRVFANPRDRIAWVIVIREMSFAGGAWILAGNAMREQSRGQGKKLITVGRVLIAIAAIFFGAEHFLHPAGCPGVRHAAVCGSNSRARQREAAHRLKAAAVLRNAATVPLKQLHLKLFHENRYFSYFRPNPFGYQRPGRSTYNSKEW